jgi:hypothetical protein
MSTPWSAMRETPAIAPAGHSTLLQLGAQTISMRPKTRLDFNEEF